MLSIADRLDDAFQSLPGNAYPIAIELSPDDAVAFQIWINVYARRASPLAKDFWRFGGIPVTCVDAWSSQVICQLENSPEGCQFINRSIITL